MPKPTNPESSGAEDARHGRQRFTLEVEVPTDKFSVAIIGTQSTERWRMLG